MKPLWPFKSPKQKAKWIAAKRERMARYSKLRVMRSGQVRVRRDEKEIGE